MEYRADELDDLALEHLMNALVVPRPIAWVGSQNAAGVRNLAPFSYFNVVNSAPPVVMVSFSPKGKKDSLANILETEEFVVNVVTHRLRHPMVASAADVAADVDEMALLGLEAAPSTAVGPTRVAHAAAALECRLHGVMPVFGSTVVFGRVLVVHVSDRVIRDGRVPAELLEPVARLGGSMYTTVTSTYRIDRPKTEKADKLRSAALGEQVGG